MPRLDAPDLDLEAGCLLCGGVLSIRIRPGSARSVCRTCGWHSRPHVLREQGGVHLHHPAGAVA